MATAGSLAEALDTLVRWIERSTTALCAISLVDRDRQRLMHAAAPSLPAAFNAAATDLPIADGVGSCGSAAATRQAVIVTDIATDWRWDRYRAIAAEHQLAACWSQPIFATSGDVLGTFALYHRAPASPAPDERQLMVDAALVAALVIERARLDDARRDAELGRHEAALKLRRVGDAVRDLLMLVDAPDGRVRFANAAASAAQVVNGAPLEDRALTPEVLASWVHPDDRGTVASFVHDALHGVARAPIEIRQRLTDGSDRWIRCRHVVLAADAAGAPQRVLFVGSDVTAEHVLAEQTAAAAGPRRDASASEPASPQSHASRGDDPNDRLRGRRILIVDDEPDVIRVVAKRLQRIGCDVEAAADGEEALQRLLAGPRHFDLVLTDQTMPRRTGEQLLLAMRESAMQIPVVVMSGYSATVTPDRMLALGASAFLPKPFDGTQLLAALSAALGR